MFKYTLWKCFERNFQWSSVNILWAEVFYIQHRQTTSDFCKWWSFYTFLQNSFCGSYRLTTYCELLNCWQLSLQICQNENFVIWELYSNLKEGFAMLFVNTLLNLDEIHVNMSNTLTFKIICFLKSQE